MALLTIAGKDDNETTAVRPDMVGGYSKDKDIRNLLFYCHNHCVSMVLNRLYPLGMDCIYDQYLYLQSRRVAPLSVRALHYILSFDSYGYESDLKIPEISRIMSLLSAMMLREYQHLLFLHVNKPSHLHIHIVINPVNPDNLLVCRLGFVQIRGMVAEILGICGIPLQSVTYRDHNGVIRYGNEEGAFLYQDKYMKKYGIPARSFL